MPGWSNIWKALTTQVNTPQVKEPEPINAHYDMDDFRDHYLTVHIAFAALRELQECNSYHEMPKLTENLRDTIEKIKLLSLRPDYLEILKKGATEFNENWSTGLTTEELERIGHPGKIDVNGMIREKYGVLAPAYRVYWESAIAGLVRKSAILKRRQYLIDDIDRFISTLPAECPDAVEELEKYKAFNQDQVESLV